MLNNVYSYDAESNRVIISTPGPQGIPGPYAASVAYAASAGLVTSASGIPTRWYGSFYDTSASQVAVGTGSATAMRINTTVENNGISINSSSIIFHNSGVYNLQFSTQFVGDHSGDIHVWLKRNGSNVSWSNTKLSIPQQSTAIVAAWNFVQTFDSGDYAQLYWAVTDTAIKITSTKDINRSFDELVATFTKAEEMQVMCNFTYIKEILALIDSNDVNFFVKDSNFPMIVKDVDNKSFFYVV
ncbi:MAG: hypothetical protein EB127_29150, partial [Alphaproteobacteria bacterium]|nr:hypothetical protein [Alphaproteobacteria bacterium]